MRSGMTCNWSDDIWKLNAPSKQSNVCVSATESKEQIKFVYPVLKWLRTKILNENLRIRVGKKDQSLFQSWIDHRKGDKLIYAVAKVHFWQTFCAENETVVRKILKVRESFESSRVRWSQERRDKVGENHMYWQSNSQQQTSAVRSVMTSALYNDFRRWRSILNYFSVDEKCSDGCWESGADFQISV